MTLTAFAPLPVVEQYKEIVEDREFPTVREWRRRTGRAVAGSFPVYSPFELAYAARMLPVGLFGGGNQIEIAHADSRFQSFICSIVKSTLELGFIDKLAPFDALLFHSICDPARNLASVMQRNFPERRSIYVHLAQNMTSAGAADYLAYEYRRVAKELGEVSGHAPADDDVRASIEAFNGMRDQLRELYALRASNPEKLSTAELYTLARMATFTDPAESTKLLAESLEAAMGREARPKDRIRVVVVGSFCEQPPLELIAGIEESGCYILDDDFLLGWRLFKKDVPSTGDPYLALARSYLNDSLHASTKHDLRNPRAAGLIASARAHKADAVIFLGAKFCEPGLFDYALYRRALEQEGIPHLFLEFEEKMWMYDKIRTEVETFVESMLFV
ncbi:MAG TPA: 2-hydroxyacyl-CoA dehydratase [Candidatus Limnocylindria bacterium]|nr:2-hydroxyacyl-CoA dehydratase [Candidatus Limnocylindria bacterium]